jgi:hypothetical protein
MKLHQTVSDIIHVVVNYGWKDWWNVFHDNKLLQHSSPYDCNFYSRSQFVPHRKQLHLSYKTNTLILYREIIAVYSKNYKQIHRYTLWARCPSPSMLKYSNQYAL